MFQRRLYGTAQPARGRQEPQAAEAGLYPALMDKKLTVSEICKGNPEAIDFINRWSNYVHAIDDIIDEDKSPDFIVSTFARAIEIHTHPFWLKNLTVLKQVELQANNIYCDTVICEKSDEKWKQHFADWGRHGATEMVLAVAAIVGGYEHMRSISLEMRKLCYFEHHDEHGNPK